MSDDSDADNVDRQIQHRTNTLMHVCWHRNTSVSMVERSIAIRVSPHLHHHCYCQFTHAPSLLGSVHTVIIFSLLLGFLN